LITPIARGWRAENIEAAFEADLREPRVDHGTNAHATSPEAGSNLDAVNARISPKQ
jgi:hypothetical protein